MTEGLEDALWRVRNIFTTTKVEFIFLMKRLQVLFEIRSIRAFDKLTSRMISQLVVMSPEGGRKSLYTGPETMYRDQAMRVFGTERTNYEQLEEEEVNRFAEAVDRSASNFAGASRTTIGGLHGGERGGR